MNSFRDLFGSRRRETPRLPVRWFIDLQLPGSEQYVGFFTCDISVLGLRLVGEDSDAFERTLDERGLTRMRLRFPVPKRALFPWPCDMVARTFDETTGTWIGSSPVSLPTPVHMGGIWVWDV